MTEWKTVKMLECPDCGELVRDMDDARNHICRTDDLDAMWIDQFIKWLDAKCTVAWSRETALEQFANQTPLWNEYVNGRT